MDITSVVSFFRLRPWQGELCLQIPGVFWHNVQMYHWGTRPRCPAGFGGNIWTTMTKSRMTAFPIGLSAIFVLGLGKNFIRSAFCTLLWDCPFGKGMQAMAGYHNWRLVQFTIFTDFGKLCTTFRKTHSPPSKFLFQLCLLKGSFCCLFFFRGSVISLLLLTKALNYSSSSPIFGIFCAELPTAASPTSFMWIETNWRPSSMNRFPISSREGNNKTFYTLSKCVLETMFLFMEVMILCTRYAA